MHCSNPSCVTVCPSGALYIDEETGLVTYDSGKCIGCQYCRAACPFDVPRHTNVGLTGNNIKINKCTGCVDRVKQGRKPACVSTCQPGALQFGDRDEMIKMAHERVEYLKSKGFEQASVYGEDQMGGTHVIYVLKYGLDQYELPADPQQSGITDALKFYMDDRFGVDAPEMTTAELFDALKSDKDITPEMYSGLKDLFERADFVKFAKHIATDEENARALPLAVSFVTTTYQADIQKEASGEEAADD